MVLELELVLFLEETELYQIDPKPWLNVKRRVACFSGIKFQFRLAFCCPICYLGWNEYLLQFKYMGPTYYLIIN